MHQIMTKYVSNRTQRLFSNPDLLSLICLSIVVGAFSSACAKPPYIPGMGLTNEIEGKIGDDAAVSVYDKSIDPKLKQLSERDPNVCQEKAASPYLTCDWSSPYRNIDGTCNNPRNKFIGATGECYGRFISAIYKNRGDARLSVSGSPLPLPRQLSLNTDLYQPSQRDVSMMFTVFGQYVAHDTSLFLFEPVDGSCCSSKNAGNPNCMNVVLGSDDPFFSKHNVTCSDFIRARACASCGTGHREHQNGQTAAIDASITYAAQIDRSNKLRMMDGTGRLKFDSTTHGDLLPRGRPEGDLFCPARLDRECFNGGDVRLNQHVYLMSWQTIFLLEHNRLATLLKTLNSLWDEERLFQEARRLVIAELQCVTYKKYLPILLGQELMDMFNLTVHEGQEGTRFDPGVPLRSHSEFIGAVFRLHSMISPFVGVPGLRFGRTYTHPQYLREGRMGELMAGVCSAAAHAHGWHFTNDTTDHLYQLHDEQYGKDLVSIDVQRGRDLGLPPYVDAVNYCSEDPVEFTSFDQLLALVGAENVRLLKKNYEDVRDVDLWVGFQMETPLPGSLLGLVGLCMVGAQFAHYKFGDRFFFDHEGETPSFTAAQRSALKECSVSRLLCDNVRGMSHVPKDGFLLPSTENPLLSCDQVPEIDLSLWKEIS